MLIQPIYHFYWHLVFRSLPAHIKGLENLLGKIDNIVGIVYIVGISETWIFPH